VIMRGGVILTPLVLAFNFGFFWFIRRYFIPRVEELHNVIKCLV
jgi:hypothetical protein